jgi:excisionase family DNA binding protein
MAEDEWLTTGQAAKLLGVSRSTVLRQIDAGTLQARRLPHGHWRIPRASAENLRCSGWATYGDDLDTTSREAARHRHDRAIR